MEEMSVFQYILLILDGFILFVFFYKVLKNLQSMKMMGMFKAIMTLLIVWFGAKLIGLDMTMTVFGTIISYSFLAVMILFPDEFKRMLDQYGRKRKVIKWNKDKLLDKEGRKGLAKACMELSRRREGAYIIIARESDLQDEIERGESLGEIKVTKEMIETLCKQGSEFNKGALIIKDNAIVSANSLLNIAKRDDLIRRGAGNKHLSALWVTHARDCVALVVSAETGGITISGKVGKRLSYNFSKKTKDMDIYEGMDEVELEYLIESLLSNKESNEQELSNKRTPKKKLTKEERQQELKEKQRQKELEREEKRKNRGKKKPKKSKKKRKDEEEFQPSKGFR